MKLSPPEVSSFAAGVFSVCSALTLNQVGVLVGIFTALLTCIANSIYMHRKDRREEREFLARIDTLKGMK